MSGSYPFLVLAPVAALAVFCAAHILLARWESRRPYRAILWAFVCGLAALAAGSAALLRLMQVGPGDFAALLALNLITYLALAFGYLNFVNLNLTSLRIRMLFEIQQSGGELQIARLLERYGTQRMVELRLQRLILNQHIVERDGRYFLGKRQLLAIAAAFDLMRLAVFGRSSAAKTAQRGQRWAGGAL